jgi:hypothetical protein
MNIRTRKNAGSLMELHFMDRWRRPGIYGNQASVIRESPPPGIIAQRTLGPQAIPLLMLDATHHLGLVAGAKFEGDRPGE